MIKDILALIGIAALFIPTLIGCIVIWTWITEEYRGL